MLKKIVTLAQELNLSFIVENCLNIHTIKIIDGEDFYLMIEVCDDTVSLYKRNKNTFGWDLIKCVELDNFKIHIDEFFEFSAECLRKFANRGVK